MKDKNGRVPIHTAIRTGAHSVLSELIDKADLNQMDPSSMTPLQIAVIKGDVQLAKTFLNKGANVNMARYNFGETPLELAVSNGNIDMAKMLLHSGANVHVVDFWNNTPLMQAVSLGNIRMVDILLQHGARKIMFRKNKSGLNAVSMMATTKHNCEILKLLFPKEKDTLCALPTGPELTEVILSGCACCTAYILDFGLDINKKDIFGRTPLYHAIAQPTCLQCCASEPSPMLQDGTPCYRYHEITNKTVDVAQYLIKQGADISHIWYMLNLAGTRKNEPVLELCVRAYGFKNYDSLKAGFFFRSMIRLGLLKAAWLFTMAGYQPTGEDLLTSSAFQPIVLAMREMIEKEGAKTVYESKERSYLYRIVREVVLPRTLQVLSAQAVRRSISRNVIHGAQSLLLPKSMRKLVTLHDLDNELPG